MVSPSLYRLSLIPVVLAALVLLFSVVTRPPAERADESTDAFAGGHAAALSNALSETAPERVPGSDDAAAATEFVTDELLEIEGGQVETQKFTAPVDGEDAEMTNISLLLPGEIEDRLVILAPRDCPEGGCAASSAAETGVLIELARAIDITQHTRTVQLVSTEGASAGGAGAEALADLLRFQPPDAAIAILRPGSPEPSPPFVLAESAGSQSASVGLVESAEVAVGRELRRSAELPRDTFGSLMQLAVPLGVGDSAVLISRGIDAVGISSEGDLPLDPEQDTPANVSAQTLAQTGRAALSLFLALDASTGPLEHGPGSYIPLAGKLLPDWAIALLALTLLLPVGLVSADALIRAHRSGAHVYAALGWAALWCLPFLATLLLAYLLELIGLLPGPPFPYVPRLNDPGAGGIVSILLLSAALFGGLWGVGRLRARPEPETAPAAVGAVAFAGGLALWVLNPFLALLAVPAVHAWPVTAARARGRGLGILALIVGLVPAIFVFLHVGDELGVGGLAPWHLLLLVSGKHLGFTTMLCLCLLGGALAAALDGLLRPKGRSRLDAYAKKRG